MKALSELLGDLGWTLTGSDMQPAQTDAPDGRILRIHQGHNAQHVTESVEALIYSPAIREDNPERVAARERGIAELSYVDAISRLMSERRGIAIAGTHGKTTTTAMVATILREAGLGASALIGGEALAYERSGWAGDGELLVVEACEYRRHFLSLSPEIAAILNIEQDHFDCFTSLDDARAAFAEFAMLLPAHGQLVVRADVARTICSGWLGSTIGSLPQAMSTGGLLRSSPVPPTPSVETFSLDEPADWTVRELRHELGRYSFEIHRRAARFCDVSLSVPGKHNVEDALAAAAVAVAAGADSGAIAAGLKHYQGARRRLNVIAERDGVVLVDDYAHHPTALTGTLQTVRDMFPGRRLVAVFQPHQVSRTESLLPEFVDSLQLADEVVLVPIFAARESNADAASCIETLRQALSDQRCSVRLLASLDQVLGTLHDLSRPGDVWLTLGAGDIDRIPHEFARHVS